MMMILTFKDANIIDHLNSLFRYQPLEDVKQQDCYFLRCYLRASPEAKLMASDVVSDIIQKQNEIIEHLTKINEMLGDTKTLKMPTVII